MNDIKIHAVRDDDVESAVEVLVQACGEVRRQRIHDRLTDRAAGLHHALVAEDGGVIGAALLCADPLYPDTLFALAAVAADRRGAGIGTELVTTLVAQARAVVKPAQRVSLTLPDDQTAGRRFAERLGFRAIDHSVGWRMPLAGRGDELRRLSREASDQAGVRIVLTTPAADPDLATDVVVRSLPGLPRSEGEETFDVRESRNTVPEDTPVFLAFPSASSAGRALAISTIVPVGTDGEWLTVYTGVDADHRGRGIARAVKTAALAYVADHGGTAMITHNDETNEPILHVNKSLGMRAEVGFWTLARHGLPTTA